MVEHLTLHPKIEGSKPTTGPVREKAAKYLKEGKPLAVALLVEQLTHDPKFKGSNPPN